MKTIGYKCLPADGDFIKTCGTGGEAQGQFNKPHSMTFDSQGNVYVTDMNNYRIQKFDSEGKFITMWGSEGEADGQFLHPHGIGIDSQNNLYVTDAELIKVKQAIYSNGALKAKPMDSSHG